MEDKLDASILSNHVMRSNLDLPIKERLFEPPFQTA
jgi:hypothetical protein